MDTQKIIDGIVLNAMEIAREIEDAEYIQAHGGSEHEKESARRSAYDRILDLIGLRY